MIFQPFTAAAIATAVALPLSFAQPDTTRKPRKSGTVSVPQGTQKSPKQTAGLRPYKPKKKAAQSGSVAAVTAAYVAIWVILLLYLAKLHRRQKKIESDLHELEQRVAEAGDSPDKAGKGDS